MFKQQYQYHFLMFIMTLYVCVVCKNSWVDGSATQWTNWATSQPASGGLTMCAYTATEAGNINSEYLIVCHNCHNSYCINYYFML